MHSTSVAKKLEPVWNLFLNMILIFKCPFLIQIKCYVQWQGKGSMFYIPLLTVWLNATEIYHCMVILCVFTIAWSSSVFIIVNFASTFSIKDFCLCWVASKFNVVLLRLPKFHISFTERLTLRRTPYIKLSMTLV